MPLSDLGSTSPRIVEICPEDGSLGSQLIARGASYLGVVRSSSKQRAIVDHYPELAERIVVSTNQRIVRANNGELLIVNGRAVVQLARYRNFRHASFIAIPLRRSPDFVLGFLHGAWQWLLGRTGRPKTLRLAGCPTDLVVFSVRRPHATSGARRYIPHSLGVRGFLKTLSDEGTRHAVLRWFDSLPEVAEGEDLDLLVADADLPLVSKLLDSGPGVQAVDLYSVTGLPGSEFRAMPYYPPYLAEQILDRAIDHRGLCRVPAAHDHFLSLAYHALYHKGEASRLAKTTAAKQNAPAADHDYPSVLRELAQRLGLELPITLDDLDRYLDTQGWRPAHDMLIRLARHNRWIRSQLEKANDKCIDNKITIFLLREMARERGGSERACRLLEEHGFEIVARCEFDEQRAKMIARSIRGGNWGRGPWPISGGAPIAAIVTFDPAPIAPTRQQRRRHPFVANARILCKEQIRDAFNEGVSPGAYCNVVHSSDNGREALDYLRILAPEENHPLHLLACRLRDGEQITRKLLATLIDDMPAHTRQAA